MKRNQVFCRAYDETGKIGNADVFDLDEESFRAFVIGILMRCEVVVGIKDEFVDGNHLKLRMKPGILHKRDEDEESERSLDDPGK